MFIRVKNDYMYNMTDQIVPKTEKSRKKKDYSIAFIRRSMKEYSSGQYRIAKDAPAVVSKAIEKFIKDLTLNATEFAMNSGRCTIKAKDVYAALKVGSQREK